MLYNGVHNSNLILQNLRRLSKMIRTQKRSRRRNRHLAGHTTRDRRKNKRSAKLTRKRRNRAGRLPLNNTRHRHNLFIRTQNLRRSVTKRKNSGQRGRGNRRRDRNNSNTQQINNQTLRR